MAETRSRKQAEQTAIINAFNDQFAGIGQLVADADGELWVEWERLEPNPYQPRLRMRPARIRRMVKSLNKSGQLQEIVVRPHPTRANHWQIASGGTRRESVRQGGNAGSHKQPRPEDYIGKLRITIRDLSDAEMLDLAKEENDEREDLSVFDQGNYYRMLQKMVSESLQLPEGEFVPWEEIVALRKRAGRPLPHTARSIRRIVDVFNLPQVLFDRLIDLNLDRRDEDEDEERFTPVSEKHVRAFLMLQPAEQKNPEADMNLLQETLLDQLELERLSANETLRRAAAFLQARDEGQSSAPAASSDVPRGTLADGVGGWFPSGSGTGGGTGSGITTGHSTVPSGTGGSSQPRFGLGNLADTSGPPEPPAPKDPVADFLKPAAAAIRRCREQMVLGNTKVIPPSEIEQACQEILRAVDEIRGKRTRPIK